MISTVEDYQLLYKAASLFSSKAVETKRNQPTILSPTETNNLLKIYQDGLEKDKERYNEIKSKKVNQSKSGNMNTPCPKHAGK